MSCINPILKRIPRANLPLSVQLVLRAADHPGTHVLDYLAKCEHAAALRNRRDLVTHYHECWLLVFERVGGVLPLPIVSVQPRPMCPPPEPRPFKGWEKQKYSKPLRKVLKWNDVPIRDDKGNIVAWETLLTLECGHVMASFVQLAAEAKPKHRRCRECSRPENAAMVEAGRLKGGRQ
jgi:hypothetical protein